MARVHVSDDVWAEFRRAAGNTPMSQILGRLVEREVERDPARRIRQGTVDDQVVLDALERARELQDDVVAIIAGSSAGPHHRPAERDGRASKRWTCPSGSRWRREPYRGVHGYTPHWKCNCVPGFSAWEDRKRR